MKNQQRIQINPILMGVKFSINPKKSLDFFELRLTIENESNISSRQCKEIVHFQC